MKKSILATIMGTTVTTAVMGLGVNPAHAIIFALDDSHSWVSGTNTLTNLGYTMSEVTDSGLGGYQEVSSLSSPNGNITFSPTVYSAFVPSEWATWSNNYTGEVYWNQTQTLTIGLPNLSAFDFYAEPNPFDFFNITATAQDGTSITQSVSGDAGAKYYGFYATNGNSLQSITISSSADFAVGQFRAAPVPEPLTILGTATALGFGAFFKRKLKSSESAEKETINVG
jgi:hypothetical protein